MASFPVQLLVYDLSQGMAQVISLSMVGRQIDGIWHTSVLVHGLEWYFGQGVFDTSPGDHHHGKPVHTIDMGYTEVDLDLMRDLIDELRPRYQAEHYHLLDHNCNSFTNELCQLLVSRPIPEFISNLPRDFINTPFGQSLRPFIDSVFSSPHALPPTAKNPSSPNLSQPNSINPIHPHVSLELPKFFARLMTAQVSSALSPKMWNGFSQVVTRLWRNNNIPKGGTNPTLFIKEIQDIVGQGTAASLHKNVDGILKELLLIDDGHEDRWIIIDVARALMQSEAWTESLRDVIMTSLSKDQTNLSPLPIPLHLTYMRAITNAMAHSKQVHWFLDATSDRRAQFTSLLISGLLREHSTPVLCKSAASLAFNVARGRVDAAHLVPNINHIWSPDGSDEEWAMEVLGAVSHVLTHMELGTDPVTKNSQRTTAMMLYDTLCGLLFTAPPALFDLVVTIGFVPQSLSHLVPMTVLDETRSLFDSYILDS